MGGVNIDAESRIVAQKLTQSWFYAFWNMGLERVKQQKSSLCKASHKDVRNAKSYVGHSDYQAMKPYIEIAEKTKANLSA